MKNKYTIKSILKIGIYKIVLLILRIIMLMPYKCILAIGKALGLCVYLFLRKLRLITEINLELCFPKMSEKKRHLLVRESFRSLGMGIMEIAYAWFAPNHKLPPLKNIKGIENIENAIDNNDNIIMLGIHQVSAELAGRMFSLIHPFNAVYQKSSNHAIDNLILNKRKKIYKNIIANNKIRTMVNSLNNKEMLWFASDQGQRKKHSVFVPFFGVNTSSSTSASKLAKLANATVIPVSCARTKDMSGYEITIHPKLTNFPSQSLSEDAMQINKVYEKIIRDNPEQYVWQYKRFKNTPDGSINIYDQRM